MSNKKEIYYKFIFPTYENLSGSDNDSFPTIDGSASNPFPTCDGKDQLGEVRALCRECPARVITYDQLAETNINNLEQIYKDSWETSRPSTQPYDRVFIKTCVDEYLKIPKYFNLRNYMDACPCQEGGMSLMVSHTPEVDGDYGDWTKFTVGTKTVYCSLMISSGDFFYGFCLPDEVIEKSGLRDEVVKPTQYTYDNGKTLLIRFHSNWCFNIKERYGNNDDGYNSVSRATQSGQEKRVFVQHYFSDGFNYCAQNAENTLYYVNFSIGSNFYKPTSEEIHCIDKLGNDKDEVGTIYTGSFKNLPHPDWVDYYYLGNKLNILSRNEYTSTAYAGLPSNPSNPDDNTRATKENTLAWKYVEKASDYAEDLKRDFIDLEATRRILYYHDGTKLKYGDGDDAIRNIHPTSDIPRIIGDNKGTATVLSYEPPDEYLDKVYDYTYIYGFDGDGKALTNTVKENGTPPLQIPYNLLRYCLNDRPPFSDCETVLVMWVADKDPMSLDITSVKDLHDKCNFQQYAIPISVRCCFKDNNACNTDRFLVLYPHGETTQAKDEYAFHFRRTAKYGKYGGTFKEALYLQDLIRYSNDYIISLRYKSIEANFIQRYLFENASSSFEELYVRKGYKNTNREKQFYYVKVDKSLYDIDTNIETCFVKSGTTTQFVPSTALADKYQDWDLDKEDWVIRNDWLIALFDKSGFVEKSGTLTLVNSVNSEDLREKLNKIAPPPKDAKWSWDDIYLSSLGISPYSQINHDFMKLSGSISGDTIMLPLDVLDGHIKIGSSITYGSKLTNTSTSEKAIVLGFKDVFDYTNEDYHHFKYDSQTKSYILTKNQNSTYTAYVRYL